MKLYFQPLSVNAIFDLNKHIHRRKDKKNIHIHLCDILLSSYEQSGP